jgi:transposase
LIPSAIRTPTTGEVLSIMRALETEVVNAVFTAIEPLLPPPVPHPLGCHRRRVPDRLCFRGILIRLVTGSSWVDIEAI